MKLATYIERKGLTLDAFGGEIGRNVSTVSRLVRGIHKPDWPTLAAIYAATGGRVKPNDFMDGGFALPKVNGRK